MALINYAEAIDVGGMFAGIGALFVALVLCYIFYRIYIKFAQYIDVILNREAKYEILEESFLDKIASKKGIDLNKELVRRNMFDKKKKSFRKRIEEQIYQEMFNEKKEMD